MKKAILIGASPNTESDDANSAFRLLLMPWTWSRNRGDIDLKAKISELFGTKNVFLYDSGRSAITEVLHSLGIGPGDEVLVHAFTCLVVSNPVMWVGARPIYVDVNPNNFNFDLNDLKKKLTKKTKAVIVQHTFGIPEDVSQIRKIVGPKVKIIEDLAHSLGSVDQDEGLLGTKGDAAILTFGIEKVISSVRGGAAIVYSDTVADKMNLNYQALPKFPKNFLALLLFNPIFWWLVTPIYYFGFGFFTLGRAFVFIGHKLGVLGKSIESGEYEGTKPKWMPAKMSGTLALLALNQWKKLEKFNNHRAMITKIYDNAFESSYGKELKLLRYPLLIKDRAKLVKKARQKGIVIGDWYKKILYSKEKNLSSLLYKKGTCPKAEKIGKQIINLPTFIKVDKRKAEEITQLVKKFI